MQSREAQGVLHTRLASWTTLAHAIGPAFLVMLADTEVGSVIVASQSGAEWGYRLLLPQLLLIPPLFIAQELAGRLGMATGQGLIEVIRRRSGIFAAALFVGMLLASGFAALLIEFGGIVGVGSLFGIPAWVSGTLTAGGLLVVVFTKTHRTIEVMAIVVGLFETSFIALAWFAHPSFHDMLAQSTQMPLGDQRFLSLLAANLGTCVMPWAIYYQQRANFGKCFSRRSVTVMRWETLAGAIFCQLVTAAIVIASASAFGRSNNPGHSLSQVGEISAAFSAIVGPVAGGAVFAVGLIGCALVASMVVCLAAGWALGDLLGQRPLLVDRPTQAPWFIGTFTVVLLCAVALVSSGINLIELSIYAGTLNALFLPVMLLYLWWAARYDLAPGMRMRSSYSVFAGVILALTGIVGIYAGLGALRTLPLPVF